MTVLDLELLGTRVFAVEQGTGEHVLLVHGIPTSSFLWRGVIDRLAPRAHVVAPDLPGFGKSSPPRDGDHRLGAFTRFLEALVEQVFPSGARFHLAVHDVGGPAGLLYAVRHPERVASLTILNTTVFPRHFRPPVPAMLGAIPVVGAWLIEHRLTERLFKAGMARTLPRGTTRDVLDAYWRPYLDAGRRRSMAATFASYGRSVAELREIRAGLGALRMPTSIVFGADDPYCTPPNARAFARRVQHAKLRLVEGAGHFVQEARPDVIADEIAAFLS